MLLDFINISSEWHSKNKLSIEQKSDVIFPLLYVLTSFVKAEYWNSAETMEHLGRLYFNNSGFLAEFGSNNRGTLKKSTGNFFPSPQTEHKIEDVVVHVYICMRVNF